MECDPAVLFVLIRCTAGTKPDPDCDPKFEAEVVKPHNCGKIKDPAGPFRSAFFPNY